MNDGVISQRNKMTSSAVGVSRFESGRNNRLLRLIIRTFEGLLLLSLSACTTGPCQRDKNISSGEQLIFVFKYDGSQQCGLGNAVSVEQMAKELESIKIRRMEKRSDGLLRAQGCGMPSGQANIYEISKEDLDSALKRNFELWQF